jgi:hypothetical protein
VSDPEIQARFEAVDSAARKLGYIIGVDKAPNMAPPITHMAWSHPDIQQPSMGTFLCYSTSEIEAAEAGLEILRRVVERGGPWPDRT